MGRNREDRLTDVTAKLRHATPKAYLLYDGAREEWVAKSQCENNGDGTFTMPEWLAKEKGFI